MKIKFTCPKCGGHVLICKSTQEVQRESNILGIDDMGMPIVDDNPATEGYRESPEIETYQCGNPKCQAPVVDVGHPDLDEVIAIGQEEGWIKKVEE